MMKSVQTTLRKNKVSIGIITILSLALIYCSYPSSIASVSKDFAEEVGTKGIQLLTNITNGIKFIPTNRTYTRHQKQISSDAVSTKGQHHGGGQLQSLPTKEVIRDRFEARNKLIQTVCQNLSLNERDRLREVAHTDILNFFKGHLKYCRLRKVASTFLKYMDKSFGVNITYKVPYNKVKRFLVVRDPYSRMVSGYIDRVVTFAHSWKFFGSSLAKKFRPNSTEICGHDISFPEFVKYFIFSQKNTWRLDDHFIAMTQKCNPCRDKFHFVTKLETLKEDMMYILNAVNQTTNVSFRGEKDSISAKSHILKEQESEIKRCTSMCLAMRSLFWSFQTRGFIGNHIQFPVDENECDSISGDEMTERFWKAHVQSIGKFDKSKQIRQAMVDLFLQVPLEDRIEVRDLLVMDFKLFGYDPQPIDLFPELIK